MDPNATLANIEYCIDAGIIEYANDAVEGYDSLMGWIRSGGFEPDWAKYPRATYFVNGLKMAGC